MSALRKSQMYRIQTAQNLPNQFDIRKTLLPQNLNNNIIHNYSSSSQLLFPNLINSKNTNKNNNDINDIFKLIIEESKSSHKSVDSFHSIKLLEIYIRKNRGNIDLIVNKILESENTLDENILTYINQLVQNLITENTKSINFLQKIIQFLINLLSKNIDLAAIYKINSTLKRLIKIGGNNTHKIIEDKLEHLIQKFVLDNKDNKTFKYESSKLAYIQFFCIVLKSAPAIFYSNFI